MHRRPHLNRFLNRLQMLKGSAQVVFSQATLFCLFSFLTVYSAEGKVAPCDDVFRSEPDAAKTRSGEDDIKVGSNENRDGRDKTPFAPQQRNSAPIVDVSSLVVLIFGVGWLVASHKRN